MSRSNKGAKKPGTEYFGKRAFSYVFGFGWKRLTNQTERARQKQEVLKELNEAAKEKDRC
jgi:hypothetical protein